MLFRSVSRLQQQSTDSMIATNEKTSEVVFAFREIVVRGRQRFYSEKINQIRLNGADSSAELSFLQYIGKYIIELTIVIGTLMIIGVQFATQTASHAISVLTIFIAATTRIAPSILRIQQSLLSVRGNAAAAQLTFEFLDDIKGGIKI